MLTTIYLFNDGHLSTVAPYSLLAGYTMYTATIPQELNPTICSNGNVVLSPDNTLFDMDFSEAAEFKNNVFTISYYDINNNLITYEIKPIRKQVVMPAEELI